MAVKAQGQLKESGVIVLDTQDVYEHYEVNQAVNVTVTAQNERSLAHHNLFFGGLIELMKQYWDYSGGLIKSSEIELIELFVNFLSQKVPYLRQRKDKLMDFGMRFLQHVAIKRAEKITLTEPTEQQKTEQVLRYIKDQLNMFDLVPCASGYEREYHSISFAKMSQERFNEFYKAAFTVCWNRILSSKFESEAQAQQAIDQLMGMG